MTAPLFFAERFEPLVNWKIAVIISKIILCENLKIEKNANADLLFTMFFFGELQ